MNITYVDDTVLIADTEEDHHILDKVIEENEFLGLPLNAKKAYSMTASKKQIPPKGSLGKGIK